MKKIFLLFALFIFITGCREEESEFQNVSKYSDSNPASSTETSDRNIPVTGRMLIKDYYLQFETADFDKANKEISSLTNKFGGFIENSDIKTEKGAKWGVLNIRIPSDKLGEFVSKAKEVADEVTDERISSEDITEQYIDVKARLENKKKVEEQFRDLLKRANTVDEVIRVEKELAEVRAEIESAEARMKYFENAVKLSKVTLEIYEPETRENAKPGYIRIIKNSFNTGIRGFFYVSGFLIIFIISAIPVLFIGYLIFKATASALKKYKGRKDKAKES